MVDKRTDELTEIMVDQKLLKRRVDDLEVFQKSSDLQNIRVRLDQFESSSKLPFYQDRRFWAGILAIPALILSGWTVDKIFIGKPVMLSLIHQAFGTQPVIVDAIHSKDAAVRVELEKQLPDLFSSSKILQPLVQDEVFRRFDIIHAAILQIGLNRLDRIQYLDCGLLGNRTSPSVPANESADAKGRVCEDISAAKTYNASTIFGVRIQDFVNIDLGIHLAEIPRDEAGKLAPDRLREPTNPPEIGDIVDLDLDETRFKLGASRELMQHRVGGRNMWFAYTRLENAKLNAQRTREVFPLHNLSIALNPKAPENYNDSDAAILSAPTKNKPVSERR
jgi:hypothetical protein